MIEICKNGEIRDENNLDKPLELVEQLRLVFEFTLGKLSLFALNF